MVLAAPDSVVYSGSSAGHTICPEPPHYLHCHTPHHLLQPNTARYCQAVACSLAAAHFEWPAASWQSTICSLPLATGDWQQCMLVHLCACQHSHPRTVTY